MGGGGGLGVVNTKYPHMNTDPERESNQLFVWHIMIAPRTACSFL